MIYLRRVLPLALAVSPLAAGTLIAAPAGQALTVPATAAVSAAPASGALYGVAAESATNAWAVGYRFNGTARQTLIEHWNGTSWTQETSPNPGGNANDNWLFGVSALSAQNAWAVGFYSDGTLDHTLIEHWNGISWTQVPSPDPACIPGDALNSVTAISPTNVWAVGSVTDCFTLNGTPAVFHWNGTSWSEKLINTPNGLLGGELRGVAATSANNVWAVGDYPTGQAGDANTLIEHWNGTNWKLIPSPDATGVLNLLNGVAATSGSNAWAVGGSVRNFPHSPVTVILRWNGHAWSRVPSPHPGKFNGDELLGVSAVSAGDAVAVGDYLDPVSATAKNLAVRWNGTSWSLTSAPTPPPPAKDSGLEGVAATSARNAWAVGFYVPGNLARALILHWNGTAWRRQQ